MNFLKLAFSVSSLILMVHSHSHLECTDVQSADGTCRGYPRHYNIYKSGYENTDESKDRNFVAPPGSFQCPTIPSATADAYNTAYPMAQTSTGSNLTLQWPPRGHQNQPSTDVEIFCSTNPSSTNTTFPQQLMQSEWYRIGR